MDITNRPQSGPASNKLRRSLGYCVLITAVLCMSGCGDFFSKKPTEVEAKAIINDIGQVRENPNIGNPLPEIYRAPAQRININGKVKLFYFTKNHTVTAMSALVKEQLGNKISSNIATNQLIIECASDADADAVLQFLEHVDVPPIQVNIDCLILERFGDETMDWETSIMIENFLGQGITLGANRGTFSNTVGTVGNLTSLNPAFPGASLRETKRSTFGLDFGYWLNEGIPGHQVRAVVDMLISRGYLKILLNPTLETVNGKKAMVMIRDHAPIEKIVTGKGGASDAYSLTEYQWVEDILTVTPSVYADGSVGIKTDITIGSRSKPEGVVQTSIITERSISVEENRIAPGKSLIIGGMRKSEKRSVVRGVPFFKDLPIIGALFSSKDFEEKATEIIFILTPTISNNGMDHVEMIDEIRRKHDMTKYDSSLSAMIADPFGTSAYTESVERTALEAESAKFKAEKQAELAEAEVAAARKDMAAAEAEKIAAQEAMRKAQTEAEKSKAEKDNAIADAHKAEALADKAKAEAVKAKADFEAAKAATEAEKAKLQAQQKALEEKAKQEAEKAKPENPQSKAPQAVPLPNT